MARHKDGRHLGARIAAQLRYEILSGELEAGQRLPSVEALMDRWGTANTTIQRALKTLKEEGLLDSRPGVAVTVRGTTLQTIRPADYLRTPEPGESYSWTTQAEARQQVGSNRLVSVEEVEAPRRVAQALGLPAGSPVVRRMRVGLLDDEPAEVATSYYDPRLAAGTPLVGPRLIRGGSPRVLADLGLPVRGHAEEIVARAARQEEYELLELPGDVPVLELFVVAWSDDRKVVEVTELIKAGNRYRMGYEVLAE